MYKRLLFLLLLLAPLFLTAQSNYKEGYVVNDQGDTLNGFINYREWYRNPERILFKYKPENNQVHTFTVDNATAFTVAGYESYTRFTVPVSMDEVKLSQLKDQIDTTTVTKAVFLKEILKGDRFNLYAYKDDIKERFYLLDRRQAVPVELVYRKAVRDLQETTQALYRQQLLSLAVEQGVFTTAIDRLIQTAAYSKTDLVKVVSRMNTRNETAFVTAGNKKRRPVLFFGIGLHNNVVNYSGESLVTIDRIDERGRDKFKDQVTTQAYLPRFSAGMDFYIHPAIQRLVIRTEVSALPLKSSTKGYYKFNNFSPDEVEYTYHLSAWNLSFIPQVIYNIYNHPDLKFYVGAGGSFNFIYARENSLHRKELNRTTSHEETQQDYFPLRDFTLSTVVRSGLQVKRRVDLSLIWGNGVEYTSFMNGNTSLRAGLLAFSVAYIF